MRFTITASYHLSNNQAEYEALIWGLRILKSLEASKIVIHTDSLLIQNQQIGKYAINDNKIKQCHELVTALLSMFDDCQFVKIPTEENQQADTLAKWGSGLSTPGREKINIYEEVGHQIVGVIPDISDGPQDWRFA